MENCGVLVSKLWQSGGSGQVGIVVEAGRYDEWRDPPGGNRGSRNGPELGIPDDLMEVVPGDATSETIQIASEGEGR